MPSSPLRPCSRRRDARSRGREWRGCRGCSTITFTEPISGASRAAAPTRCRSRASGRRTAGSRRPVRVEGGVRRTGRRGGCHDPAHVGAVGDTGDVPGHLRPRRAAVSADLEVAVVESDPEDGGVDRGFVERHGLAEGAGPVVARDGDVAAVHAHDLDRVAIDLPAHVLGGRPRGASVPRDEEPVPGDVQDVRVVLREHHRRRPVEAVLLTEWLGGRDVEHVAGLRVVPEVVAAVGAAVAVARILRVGLPEHPVAEAVLHPVVVQNAGPAPRLGRPEEGVVSCRPP